MSPQFATRCALAVLGATLFAGLVGLMAWGPVGYGEQVHRVSDPRRLFGVLNAFSIVLLLPAAAFAAAALAGLRRSRAEPALRRGWQTFFAMILAAVAVSTADHLAPSAPGYLATRATTASACAVLAAVFLAERFGSDRLTPRALAGLVAAGPLAALASAACQWWTGEPDLRWLLALEYLPMVLIPLSVWGLRSTGLSARDWIVALLWFAVAKLVDAADAGVWQASGGLLRGHALHHLPLAVSVGWLAWCALRQRAAPAATSEEIAASVAASRRSTSWTTAG